MAGYANLSLGADQSPWMVHADAHEDFIRDHKLCLLEKGLNPDHQNPSGIKVALPRTWRLDEQVESQVTDEGLVNFYFDTEHHMRKVIENAHIPIADG
ncbi:hypothetical protein N665_0532s0060 [Sinapis alba]|nr:hypothetical protein N665_0532s0060 [Sinapis alba]